MSLPNPMEEHRLFGQRKCPRVAWGAGFRGKNLEEGCQPLLRSQITEGLILGNVVFWLLKMGNYGSVLFVCRRRRCCCLVLANFMST